MREKLIEWVADCAEECHSIPCSECDYFGKPFCASQWKADHLIANGVTISGSDLIPEVVCDRILCDPEGKWQHQFRFKIGDKDWGISKELPEELVALAMMEQKWISVKDRLPEIVSTHKRYRSTIRKSIRVLCVCVQKSGKTMVKEGYCEWYNDYPEPRWQIPGTIDDVTHWQYLPQPPKGE